MISFDHSVRVHKPLAPAVVHPHPFSPLSHLQQSSYFDNNQLSLDSRTMSGIQSGGVYKLVNGKAGNCVDLSGGDNTSLIGFDYHGGDNQKVRSVSPNVLHVG